jgi:hypothetical protein
MKFKKQFIFPLACFAVAIVAALFLLPEHANAAITMKFQIPIPGLPESFEIKSDSIGKYILAIYNYLIGGVGILATVVMMYAGVLWITAGGSSEQIGKAKGYIGSALTGLILAFASYMILHTLNPDLLTFKPLNVQKVEELPDYKKLSDCSEISGKKDGDLCFELDSSNVRHQGLCKDNKCYSTFCCFAWKDGFINDCKDLDEKSGNCDESLFSTEIDFAAKAEVNGKCKKKPESEKHVWGCN